MPPEPFDLDAQATTPLDPRALAAMLPWLEGAHWNPHSAHRGGRRAKAAIEAARAQVAARLGKPAEGLLFLSGATEANNLALKGVMGRAPPGRRRLLTFATEHSCVLEAASHLERGGVAIDILPVGPDGRPEPARLADALGPDVALVSVMAVNNEIGAIAPLGELCALAHAAGALFHTDAAQAFGKVDLAGVDADLISLSAHKMHGPKGVGALWRRPGVPLDPLLDGGGQEDVRSGTQAPALVAGFGAAAAAADPNATRAHCAALMGDALAALGAVAHRINGPDPLGPDRWPGNLSVTFPGIDAGRLMARCPGLALASGAACSSGANRPSHVLAALGLPPAAVRQTLRIGWHGATDRAGFADAIAEIVDAVRSLAAGRAAA